MISLTASIEAILFAWAEPIAMKEISRVLDLPLPRIYEGVQALKDRYQEEDSGLKIIEVNNTIQLGTKEACYGQVEKFFEDKKKKNLSNAGLETLAIVAYKQPITKLEVEEIRGVQCDSILRTLCQIGYIESKGKLDKPGKPTIYGTTPTFLKKFGFLSIKDLPSLEPEDQEQNFLEEDPS